MRACASAVWAACSSPRKVAAVRPASLVMRSASVSKTSYLYCYMASARGSVIRLLPNGTNTSGWIQANQTIRIPDWMSPNPGFVMDAGAPGMEGVACFASDNDIRSQLPANLQNPPFTRIEGIQNLDELEAAFRSQTSGQAIAVRKLTWQVVPKPEPAPAKAPAADRGAPAPAAKAASKSAARAPAQGTEKGGST